MTLEIRSNFASRELLASTVAFDLAERLKLLFGTQDEVNLVLTGGTVGNLTLQALARELKGVDLARLQLWWGDERFVAADSSERNIVQAEDFLSIISISKSNLHPMPSSENQSLNEAAQQFAKEIEEAAPVFDIVLLGMGPDAHVASLFPGSEATAHGEWVVAEANSPKLPERRISLSYRALSSASQVWFVVAGGDKADAIKRVFAGQDLPATRVTGKNLTRWYLDEEAAKEITS